MIEDKGNSAARESDLRSSINASEQQKHLAEFDKKLGELMLATDATRVNPQLLVQTAAQHITEYGCWKANGAATLVAATILHGMARHISKYETPEAEINDYLAMKIDIHSEWLKNSDGKRETLELLRAMTNHLCGWIGIHPNPDDGPTRTNLH